MKFATAGLHSRQFVGLVMGDKIMDLHKAEKSCLSLRRYLKRSSSA